MTPFFDEAAPERRRGRASLSLLGPILLVNLVTLLWPAMHLAALSLRRPVPGGGIGDGPTLAGWIALLGDPATALLAARSIGVALLVTAITLACGLPMAMAMHRASPPWRRRLTLACLLVLLVGVLVPSYGWLTILGVPGEASGGLAALARLAGVVLALVQMALPAMVLLLLAGLDRLKPVLADAAGSLGAAPAQVFRRVALPLMRPAMMLGCALTFVLAAGNFVTPRLLAGDGARLLSTAIYDRVTAHDWPGSAALTLLLSALIVATLLLYGRMARRVP